MAGSKVSPSTSVMPRSPAEPEAGAELPDGGEPAGCEIDCAEPVGVGREKYPRAGLEGDGFDIERARTRPDIGLVGHPIGVCTGHPGQQIRRVAVVGVGECVGDNENTPRGRPPFPRQLPILRAGRAPSAAPTARPFRPFHTPVVHQLGTESMEVSGVPAPPVKRRLLLGIHPALSWGNLFDPTTSPSTRYPSLPSRVVGDPGTRTIGGEHGQPRPRTDMTAMEIVPLGPREFAVEVTEGHQRTGHRVTVPESFDEEPGLAGIDPEVIVRESFAFLLEREPATSILREFSLADISRYFPEYRGELVRRLR